MFRRLIALFMLLSITFSSAETVIGVLRDGAIHHESSAEAGNHALRSLGEHGHEDSSSHGPDHKHGTPADHCTHQHGTLLTETRVALIVGLPTVSDPFLEPSNWLDRFTDPSFRPPQA